MAYPVKIYTVLDQHRFHDCLNTIALYLAILYQSLAHKAAPQGDHAALGCKVHDKEVLIPLFNRVRIAVNYGVAAVLEFPIIDTPPPEPYDPATGEWTTLGFQALTWSVIKGQFVVEIEPWVEWLKANVSSDFQRWPDVANFSRVIRNAIVHGGTININSPNAPAVSWEGLSYSYTDLGRSIFEDDLGHGDLLVLLMALNDELDALGAPMTPP